RMKVAVDYLSSVTEDLSSELAVSENTLSGFRTDESVVAPLEEATMLLEQRAALEGMRVQTLSLYQASVAEVGVLEEQLNQIVPGLATTLASGGGRTVEAMSVRIAELEVEIEEKQAKNPQLADNPALDPEFVRQVAQVETLKAQLIERAKA